MFQLTGGKWTRVAAAYGLKAKRIQLSVSTSEPCESRLLLLGVRTKTRTFRYSIQVQVWNGSVWVWSPADTRVYVVVLGRAQ